MAKKKFLISAKRFKDIREDNKANQTEFGTLLKIRQGTVSQIERGDIDVSKTVLVRMNKLFHLNLNWWFADTGPKYLQSDQKMTISEKQKMKSIMDYIQSVERENKQLKDQLATKEKQIKVLKRM